MLGHYPRSVTAASVGANLTRFTASNGNREYSIVKVRYVLLHKKASIYLTKTKKGHKYPITIHLIPLCSIVSLKNLYQYMLATYISIFCCFLTAYHHYTGSLSICQYFFKFFYKRKKLSSTEIGERSIFAVKQRV